MCAILIDIETFWERPSKRDWKSNIFQRHPETNIVYILTLVWQSDCETIFSFCSNSLCLFAEKTVENISLFVIIELWKFVFKDIKRDSIQMFNSFLFNANQNILLMFYVPYSIISEAFKQTNMSQIWDIVPNSDDAHPPLESLHTLYGQWYLSQHSIYILWKNLNKSCFSSFCGPTRTQIGYGSVFGYP